MNNCFDPRRTANITVILMLCDQALIHAIFGGKIIVFMPLIYNKVIFLLVQLFETSGTSIKILN
jgi:hypothetical protein